MLTDFMRTIIRIGLVIGIVTLAIFAFWVVLAGLAVILLGGFIYSKITGKKLFHRTSYGNVRVVRIYPNSGTTGHSYRYDEQKQPPNPYLIRDAVEVIDVETDNKNKT